jgi:hypothetical protein
MLSYFLVIILTLLAAYYFFDPLKKVEAKFNSRATPLDNQLRQHPRTLSPTVQTPVKPISIVGENRTKISCQGLSSDTAASYFDIKQCEALKAMVNVSFAKSPQVQSPY